MNWKAEALEKLRRYEAMRRAVQNIPQELKRLELEGRGASTAHRQALQVGLEQARLWLSTTERALSALSGEERRVLQQMVMCRERGSVLRLCEELQCEQSSVYRKRDKALEKFTLALYGMVEEH